jgi:hypothetical protein
VGADACQPAGVFLLTNADQQSRYIDELADIAGKEIRFEGVDGQPLRSCPKCSAGYLVERRSKKRASFMVVADIRNASTPEH